MTKGGHADRGRADKLEVLVWDAQPQARGTEIELTSQNHASLTSTFVRPRPCSPALQPRAPPQPAHLLSLGILVLVEERKQRGVGDLHLHLLLGRAVAVANDRKHTAQLLGGTAVLRALCFLKIEARPQYVHAPGSSCPACPLRQDTRMDAGLGAGMSTARHMGWRAHAG
eukprot:363899-Chlamydomonas_euryale.AAC.1